MPGLEKLPLEEAAEDSPQTRTLLGIFYQDAVGFKSYVNSLLDSCKTINRLQTDLSTATQNFSRKLLDFENQKFPLGTDDTVLASTMKQFATIIDEISSWQAVLSTQLSDSMVMPLSKFINTDMAEIDNMNRMFCTASNGKRKNCSTVLLQAESGPDREEWLAAIQNISRENYVNNIPEAALPPSSSSASIPVSQQLPGSRHSDPALQPSSRNESLQPREKGKSRLRTRSRSDSYEPNPAPATPPPSPLDATSLPSIPIQFDMLSPSEDQPTMRSPPREGPPKRINPFSQSATEILSDHVGSTSFSEVYVVRFLGSMEVRSDKGGDVIMETIRQIMAARAIHNVFKMTELQLLITTEMLILLDPSNQGIRSQYALEDVSFFAAHHENNRLFAFITRNKGYTSTMTRFSCSVFECDASGEEICRTLSAAMQVAFQTRLNLKTQGHHAASSSSEAESLSQMSAVTSPVNVDTEAGIPALPMDPNTLTIAAVSLDDKLKLSEGASDIQDSDC
ncbi:DCC-interacting protein 13-alpha-like [Saccoglossus kowalevskii]